LGVGIHLNLRNRIARKKWVLIRVFALIGFSAAVLFNSISIKSLFVGIPASLAFIYLSSVGTGDMFFPREKRFLRQMLGLASFVLIIALLGIVWILTVRFYETPSLVSLVVVGLGISVLSAFRKREDSQEKTERAVTAERGKRESYVLVFPFLLSVAIAFYGLLLARTGEGQISVWRYIPAYFLPVFFLSSLSLLVIIFVAQIHVGLKLALVSLYSFLSHSIFLLVYYPGRYGDPWTYLGNARFIDNTGAFYAYKWLYSQRLIADIIKYEAQYGLLVFFRRMFTVDIYWVHVFLVTTLWALFVPVFSYKIAELLAAKKGSKFPLFCAFGSGLFSALIYWGAVLTAFSLGLLFLLFAVMLFLYWFKSGGKRVLFLSLLAAVASLFAHPTTGVFALSFFFVTLVLKSRLPGFLKSVLIGLTFAAYPVVSYLQNASFSQLGLLSLDNLLSLQLDVTTILLVFGFVGLLFSIRGKLVNGRSALLLFLFYVVVVVNYYVSMYGMTGAIVPFRMLSMADLVFIPFVVLGLIVTGNFLRHGFSRVLKNPKGSPARARSAGLLLVCLLSAMLITSALYQAYPRQEITEVQPAAYELEAIYYMDSISEGRYVVLGDTNLATLAQGFLGIDYGYGISSAKGVYGLADWTFWTMKLYQQMIVSPSLSIMETAMLRAFVGISYFVVSVREPYYDDIVLRTSGVLEANRTFGEDKLSLFRYTSPNLPITGNGPSVRVSFDGGGFTDVQTEYKYLSKSSVKYSAKLSGYSSYNITDYPTYWTFLDLTADGVSKRFDDSSDINTFIYVSGLNPKNDVEVVWQANDHYPHAGWKEDSFKSGWQVHPLYAPPRLSPTVTKDGNILSISADFTPYKGEYVFYYESKVVNNISTNDLPWILVKWKTTAPVASVIVAYNDGYEQQIVNYGSDSGDWTVTIVKLYPNREIAYIVVGITSLPNLDLIEYQTLYVDYILLCASE